MQSPHLGRTARGLPFRAVVPTAGIPPRPAAQTRATQAAAIRSVDAPPPLPAFADAHSACFPCVPCRAQQLTEHTAGPNLARASEGWRAMISLCCIPTGCEHREVCGTGPHCFPRASSQGTPLPSECGALVPLPPVSPAAGQVGEVTNAKAPPLG